MTRLSREEHFLAMVLDIGPPVSMVTLHNGAAPNAPASKFIARCMEYNARTIVLRNVIEDGMSYADWLRWYNEQTS